jgi:hypothetical protein
VTRAFVERDESHFVPVVGELIDLRGNTPQKKRSRRSSALTLRKKSGYSAMSSDRARRISTRWPPRIVSCNSLKLDSPLSGIGATECPLLMLSG